MEKELIEYSLALLNQVKVFHWMTTSYAQHKALDELYADLGANIDTLVETYLGLRDRGTGIFQIKTSAHSDLSELPAFLRQAYNDLKQLRTKIRQSELQNIIDELSTNINQAMYLLKLT